MWNGKNQSEYRPIRRILVKHPKDAYRSQANADAQWKDLGYFGPVRYDRVVEEFEAFVGILKQYVPNVSFLPADDAAGLDSVYVHDPIVPTNRGIVLMNMGKPQRRAEPAVIEKYLRLEGIPILGRLEAPGTHEGGDSVWIDDDTLVMAHSFRTNPEGARQMRELAAGNFEVLTYGLPYWNGPAECLHIMSFISPVDKDLAVVYSKQMPIPFREELARRGYRFVEVPDAEYATFGPNVLAVAPRVVVIPSGNPVTKAGLVAAGCKVHEYPAEHITHRGGGGPTCLTRGIERE